jgi:purine-cytosine permease-like protein
MQFDLAIWDNSNRLQRGITPALMAFVAGLVGAALGANQTKFQGPIGTWFGGDLGFELGILFAGVTYYILRARQMRSTAPGRERALQPR